MHQKVATRSNCEMATMKLHFTEPPAGPATRRAIHDYCQRVGIPASIRTIERWSLPYRIMGNKAVSDWPVVIAFLDERYNGRPLHNSDTFERLRRRLPGKAA